MKQEKKVLIISFYYPPNPAIGAKRVSKISKGLLSLGWGVQVLTIEYDRPGDRALIEIPNENVHFVKWFDLMNWSRKETKNKFKIFLFRCIRSIPFIVSQFSIFDLENISWQSNAVKKGRVLMRSNDFDVIYSSFLPVSSIVVASKLSKEFDIPWINEYRDLWTGNPYLNYYSQRLGNYLSELIEKHYIKNASAFVTVSDPLKKDLIQLYQKPSFTVYNGFDKLDKNIVKEVNFTILYSGSIYPGKRDPSPLFEALNLLINEKYELIEHIKVEFYGPIMEKRLRHLVVKYGLENIVLLNESISRDEIIEKQRKSSLLLLLGWNHEKEKGVVTGKLFEYLERKKRILAITFKEGVIGDILMKSSSGEVITDAEEIALFLKKEVSHHFKNLNDEAELKNDFNLNEYSRENQTIILDKVLKRFCK